MPKNSCSCFSARTSVSWTFALHCRSGRLQTCCFSLFAFQLFLRLNQKPPFAPREVSRCCLLLLLQCSGSASVTCFVLLFSVLLRLSCALTRGHFISLEHFLPGSAGSFTLHRCCLILSLFVLRVLCCPCWGTTHFSTFASDHENGKYARSFSVFAVFRRLRLCFLCYTVCFCSW